MSLHEQCPYCNTQITSLWTFHVLQCDGDDTPHRRVTTIDVANMSLGVLDKTLNALHMQMKGKR